MANVKAVHFTGESIIKFLDFSYPDAMRTAFKCTFKQSSTGFLANNDEEDATLSLLLYRVHTNEHLRHLRPGTLSNGRQPLALDLHYLLTVWSNTPANEQVILTWAMRQLQVHPVLDRSILRGDANWKESDRVELTSAELSHEQMARIWDKFHSSYRLSVGYTARVVLVDEDGLIPDLLPVIAERFSYEQMPDPEERPL